MKEEQERKLLEHAAEVERQRQAEKLKREADLKRQKDLEEKKLMEEQQRIREGLARQAAQGFERIKKSGSIIEMRPKPGQEASKSQQPQQAEAADDNVQKSKSVKDLASAFMDQSCNLVPHSVAEINRKSLTMSSDCLAGFTTTSAGTV